MIIDSTEQFKKKFEQYLVHNMSQKEESLKKQMSEKKQNKLQEKIPLEYQLSLKYAKDVYLSLAKIDQILKDRKDNYFSNAAYSLSSFTNQQRNQFDQQTKHALQISSEQINQLKATYQKIKQTLNYAKLKNIKTNQTYLFHLNEVILCLHHYFKKLQKQFGQFLKYNQLKKKKILSTLSIQQQKIHSEPQYFKQHRDLNKNQQFDNKDIELERQAHLFYLEKVQDSKKALQTKQTIQSINQTLEAMSKKVLDQQLLTSSFEDIGSVGINFIQEGNKNLLEANNLSKQSGKYWVMLFLSLAFSLLFVDFLKS